MMTHTPFGLRTNKLSALLENPVLIYTKSLSCKTIHIHAENAPFVDKLTRYSPTLPHWSFTLRYIPNRFRRCPSDSPPQSFPMCLIPDWFGDFPT